MFFYNSKIRNLAQLLFSWCVLDMYLEANFHIGIGIRIELPSQYLSHLMFNHHETCNLSLLYYN